MTDDDRALFYAVWDGQLPEVRDLLRRGPDPWARSHNGVRAVDVAVHMANGDFYERPGETALVRIEAYHSGACAVILELVAKAAGVSVEALENGRRLMLENLDTCRRLLADGALLDVRGLYGSSALSGAVIHGDEAKVRLLLSAGVDASQLDFRGKSMREHALDGANPAIIALFES